MAVIKEFYRTRYDGINLYKSYSDKNLLIQKVGTNEIYAEAIDVESTSYIYVETDQVKELDKNSFNQNEI